MKLLAWLLLTAGIASGFATAHTRADDSMIATSPDGAATIQFSLNDEGRPEFEASFRGAVVARGALGLNLAGAEPLLKGLKVLSVEQDQRDETYAIPVGKAASARDRSRRMTVKLQEIAAPGRRVDMEFHVADDGVALRYIVPQQAAIDEITLLDELTELTFPNDPTARLLPLDSFTTSYEKYYQTRRVGDVKSTELVGLPMLLELSGQNDQSTWIAVTEANLHDYAGMYLSGVEGRPGTLISKLSPLPNRTDGAKALARKSLTTPWRILMLADDPGRLIESNLIFNLNEPSKIADPSWIKPGRTTFPWWNGYVLEGVDFEPGLNTATHQHYIDFCAEYGIEYHSLDGTDQAWYGGPISPVGPTDVTKSVPEIDMPELLRYAQEKGVRLRLWMHWRALQPQLDEALKVYEEWGIEGIMIDFMDRDDQEMVAFYHEVAEKAAKHHLTVNWHGAYKPTGMERTWPNVLNYEAALNQEHNKWSAIGTPPEHNLNIAFIRTIAGPVDYHQGGMRNVLPEDLQVSNRSPLTPGTRGHQLAMFVIYENHLPMLADYPSAYRGQDGFEFIAAVPANWDETRVLQAELDRVLVIARRKGDAWYVGGMTGRIAAAVELPLTFLGDGKYSAELLLDASGDDPTALVQRRESVSAASSLRVEIPRGGGFTATIRPE